MTQMSDDELYAAGYTNGGASSRPDIVRLTTQGDGTDTREEAAMEEDEGEEREQEDVIYTNIQQIIPGLFIGDYTAAMDKELLKEKEITFIVAASPCTHSSLPLDSVRVAR